MLTCLRNVSSGMAPNQSRLFRKMGLGMSWWLLCASNRSNRVCMLCTLCSMCSSDKMGRSALFPGPPSAPWLVYRRKCLCCSDMQFDQFLHKLVLSSSSWLCLMVWTWQRDTHRQGCADEVQVQQQGLGEQCDWQAATCFLWRGRIWSCEEHTVLLHVLSGTGSSVGT